MFDRSFSPWRQIGRLAVCSLTLLVLGLIVVPHRASAQWFRLRRGGAPQSAPSYQPRTYPNQLRGNQQPQGNQRYGNNAYQNRYGSGGVRPVTGGVMPSSKSSRTIPNRATGKSGISAAATKDPPLMPLRMPGEFEKQRAIMLSISDWMPHHFDILAELTKHTSGYVDLLVFYNNEAQLRDVIKYLDDRSIDASHVYFSPLEMDTIWMRDFAPRIAETESGPIAVDFFYEGSRPKDDSLPKRWAETCQTMLRTVRWTAQGGNLMFNGQGIGIASSRIFEDNAIQFPAPYRPANPQAEARQMVTKEFKRACNLDQLIILEPLREEFTRHVDMFMTFLAPDHVLVGQLDRYRDPVNAAILDRNSQRLAQVDVDGSKMRVSRINFPNRQGKQWSSLTNVIMANGLVLIAKFDSDPPALIQQGIATYERLMPGTTVKVVDLTSMKALQGSLHCLSMNLPHFAPMPPKVYSYESFRGQLVTAPVAR